MNRILKDKKTNVVLSSGGLNMDSDWKEMWENITRIVSVERHQYEYSGCRLWVFLANLLKIKTKNTTKIKVINHEE